METQHIHNLIILDESGSMDVIKHATISGFNEVVQTIREMERQYPEQRHHVSLVSFNGSGIRTHIDRQPVESLHELNHRSYRPNSSTPLYDAIGLSVSRLRYDVDTPGARFLVTVLTDGEENASREYNGPQIAAMIRELKEKGWTFTYIGANHDVEKVAISLSITNTLRFESNPQSVGEMILKEKNARMNFSRKIRDKEDETRDFYKDEK